MAPLLAVSGEVVAIPAAIAVAVLMVLVMAVAAVQRAARYLTPDRGRLSTAKWGRGGGSVALKRVFDERKEVRVTA